MSKSITPLLLVAALAAAGCVSQAQFLDGKQGMAMQTAVSRGQFEMNCPVATGTILSREVVQPVLQGPLMNGIQRAEYTVGVAGCERRTTFVVVCPTRATAASPPAPAGSFANSATPPARPCRAAD